MHLDRYLGLYISETQELLRTLTDALMDLEDGGGAEALDAAFRVAHTIKGMAATMGFQDVADHAHSLEDTLQKVRDGERTVDVTLLDALLAEVDSLEDAVEASITTPDEPEDLTGAEATSDVEADDEGATVAQPIAAARALPPGTEWVVRIVIDESSDMKVARATLVRSQVEEVAEVLGQAPEVLDEAFEGELRLYIAGDVDHDALDTTVRSAGEVESVEVHPVGVSDGLEDRGVDGARYVRLDQRHLVDLADGIGDLAILFGRLERFDRSGDPELRDIIDQLGRRVDELQHAALAARMIPVSEVFDRFRRLVRDSARSLEKELDYSLVGGDIEMDREMLSELADPILHLLRNAIDHGIESPDERVALDKPARGKLTLRVTRVRSHALIEVIDDGRGVDRDRVMEKAQTLGDGVAEAETPDESLLGLLSRPGLTTVEEVSDLSGRGVGLDVVVNGVRALGGAITLESEPGQGTTVALRVPVTLALTQALRVEIAGEPYALPLTHIAEAVDLDQESVEVINGSEVLHLRGDRVPLVRLRAVLGAGGEDQERRAVVAEWGEHRAALAVDRLVGRDQVIVKAFDVATGTLPVFSGATLLSDGRAALVLDPMSVF